MRRSISFKPWWQATHNDEETTSRRDQIEVRTLTVIEFLSLDGVMQGLGSPDEDRDGGFEHGGWGAQYAEGVQEAMPASGGPTQTTAYLFGRRTYESLAAFWPSQPDE